MKLLLTLLFIFSVFLLNAQSVGINNAAPDTSAILDVTSTAKGVLIPRMTMAQKNAISSPANGLMIYQTDSSSGFWYYNGSTWKPVWQAETVIKDEIVLTTQNGFGSSNSTVPRFATILTNTGTAMTYTDSTTVGATVVIKKSGVYYITFQVKTIWNDNASGDLGIIKNTGADPGMGSLNRIAYMHHYDSFSNDFLTASATVYLDVNDVIHPFGYGTNNEIRFEIRRVF